MGMQNGPTDAPFSPCRSLVREAGPEEERGPFRGSDGVPMGSPGAYGCGATPFCWGKKGRR
jgi:hypothetical protein